MFSLESICNHHIITRPHILVRGTIPKFQPHTQSYSKITALRNGDIDCNGVHIDIAPVDGIEGFSGKYNNSNGLENDPDMKMSKSFTYEEPESSVRHRSSCLQAE